MPTRVWRLEAFLQHLACTKASSTRRLQHSPSCSSGLPETSIRATRGSKGSRALVHAWHVHETTPQDSLDEVDQHFARTTKGRMWTISMRKITPEVAGVIAQYTSKMPDDPHILFDMHELRASSPSARANDDSVFSAREPYFAFEINTIVNDEAKLETTLAWGEHSEKRCIEPVLGISCQWDTCPSCAKRRLTIRLS